MKLKSVLVSLFLPLLSSAPLVSAEVSPVAQDTAAYAVENYEGAMTDTLAELVRFETVAREGWRWRRTGSSPVSSAPCATRRGNWGWSTRTMATW
ncbi:hypothetical protein [Microbulbifer taiwanensis]|uniref:hypothetical protein n=1 Tax=Microbulbifer taiwanensis TaxID=986746 RepID=UPI00361B2F52